jgi:hypothetical protein
VWDTPNSESAATIESAGSAGRRSRACTNPTASRARIPPSSGSASYGVTRIRPVSTAAQSAAIVKVRNDHSKWPCATNGAAATGPTTRVRLLAADWSETALGMSGSGTALAASAKLAGPENAKQVPSPSASTSTPGGVIHCIAVSAASVADSAATVT